MRMRLFPALVVSAIALVLGACSSTQPLPEPVVVSNSGVSAPSVYARPANDGAPWWDVDVSAIEDAVPTPHTGRFKASTYTVLGKTYHPMNDATRYQEVGTASWYGTKFHGQATANGESYDLYGMTAAHKTLPLPSYVQVTNLANGRSVIVRVNDRGPFYSDRIIDLSFAAAKKLGFAEMGTAKVKVEGIDPVRWRAERGLPLPVEATTASAVATNSPVEVYTPPVLQHAGATSTYELGSSAQAQKAQASGVYVQVAAFANPDAAELLRAKLAASYPTPVFVSPVARNSQVLHRVRLGPIASEEQASQLQANLRMANLGQPTLVRGE